MNTMYRDGGARRYEVLGDSADSGHQGAEGAVMEGAAFASDIITAEDKGTGGYRLTAAALEADAITPTGRVLMAAFGPIMTTQQVADTLHRHQSHVRVLCQEGELPACRIGSRWHVSTVKLGAMLDGGAAW